MVAVVAKVIGALLVVVSAYFYGYHQGQNTEELKHARTQISALERAIEEHKAKQANDAQALSDLRIAESRMSGCAASCPSLKEEPKPLPIDSVIDVYNWQSRVGNYSTRLKEQLNSASRTTNNVRRTIEK